VGKIIGMHSFNEKVASATLSNSMALPHESCSIHVTEWFLIIGIVSTLTGGMQRLLADVEEPSAASSEPSSFPCCSTTSCDMKK
jgi:hypothetical protein